MMSMADFHSKVSVQPVIYNTSHILSHAVLIMGESGVGKSQLLRRYAANTFEYTAASTIGVDVGESI